MNPVTQGTYFPLPGEIPQTPSISNAFLELIGTSPVSPAAEPPKHELTAASEFLRFYGLRENPFADGIQPRFFFRTESHTDAFRDMMLAVDFEASLGLVTGTSGTGKTLVTQLLLEELPASKYCVALVLITPGLSRSGLLQEILSELSVAIPVGNPRIQDLLKLLSHQIMSLHEQGRRLILIFDECHLLSAQCLHVIRTISNIETVDRKLTTSILAGESRLWQRLAHPSFESLRNRIYLRSELRRLNLQETEQYLKFRLMTAGRFTDLFAPGAVAALHTATDGNCRRMNKLAMLSMITAARDGLALIDEDIVARCVARQ
jgi:general secretion pathway protein A